jgi:hypothetical protein
LTFVEAAAEKLRKALAAKSAAKLRGEIERIAQGLDDVSGQTLRSQEPGNTSDLTETET